MRLLFWGTYDLGKPRTRIVLHGLRNIGVDVAEFHADIWRGVEDKSQLYGLWPKLAIGLRWLFCYPTLIWQFMRCARPDAVIVGYLGQFDVLVLWPFARLRGVPVVWDAFISLYNTIVEDRRLLGRRNPLALLILAWEWLACRAASVVLVDTKAHARYFVSRFGLPEARVKSVFVGAEPECFASQPTSARRGDPQEGLHVLFYGQFIPLHGIETIIEAARLAEHYNMEWTLIGQGQEADKIRALLDKHPLPRLTWIPWVNYGRLSEYISRSDVCLGIFGDTDKAARVIPNKVFQILMAGAPLVTRDSQAIRELLTEESPGIVLVPPANPGALLAGIKRLANESHSAARPLHRDLIARIGPEAIGKQLLSAIEEFVSPNAVRQKGRRRKAG